MEADGTQDLRWYLDGHKMPQARSGLLSVLLSRKLLEYRVRARVEEPAWTTATGNDLRFPEVEGRRTPGSGLVNAYLSRFRAAAAADPALAIAFARVAGLIDPPSALLSPATVLRVLRAGDRRSPPRGCKP